MKNLVRTDFDEFYDTLNECYLTEANVGQVDGFKLSIFPIINDYIYDLLANKITIEELINTVFSKKSEEQKARILDSYNLFIGPKHTKEALKVKSSWSPLTEFASKTEAASKLPSEWANAKGLYIIRQISTGRLYIGKAFGQVSGNSFIDRLYRHYLASTEKDSTFHEIVAGHENDFECAILEICKTADEVATAEKNAVSINGYKTLYNVFDLNMRPGGEGGATYDHDQEIYNYIDELLKLGKPEEEIIYLVKKSFGIDLKSKSIVMDRSRKLGLKTAEAIKLNAKAHAKMNKACVIEKIGNTYKFFKTMTDYVREINPSLARPDKQPDKDIKRFAADRNKKVIYWDILKANKPDLYWNVFNLFKENKEIPENLLLDLWNNYQEND